MVWNPVLTSLSARSRVFFDIQIGSKKEGRIAFELVCFETLHPHISVLDCTCPGVRIDPLSHMWMANSDYSMMMVSKTQGL